MQPEINQVTQNSATHQPSCNSPASLAQHGNLSLDLSKPSLSSHGDGRAAESAGGSPGDSGAAVAVRIGAATSSERRVKPVEQAVSSVSSFNRVTEYENASTALPTHAADFGFKVVPSRTKGFARMSLEDFPNEVLTHILSHLPPATLSSMSVVNRRFHSLVTTPHAWRIAFSRYFLGPAAIEAEKGRLDSEEFEHLLLQKRAFCRLTALASWRNEYILRTRLLRSLARGKPADPSTHTHGSPRTNAAVAQAVTTYNSLLLFPVTHIDGNFGSGLDQKPVIFVHGASEQGTASVSDPAAGKSGLGSWGISDPQLFNHFADSFPGDTQWGLGIGDLVGIPNVMDVSQQYGLVYGEGCPHGRTYFLSSNEKRGRFLAFTEGTAQPQLGIPKLAPTKTSVCSVWIARSSQLLKITNGVCGILVGTSTGILSAYALGPNHSYNHRYERGQLTARWVLCPGVPIISIHIDEDFSIKRHARRRIWAVVMNALGEIFYLTDIPLHRETNAKPTPEQLDQLAWETGRTVRWELIEATRRLARPDPFNTLIVDGSYTPRSSSLSMGLNEAQVAAETAEIEQYLALKPKHFRAVCEGWDMQRKLEVDFAADDSHGAGESITVISCGVTSGQPASLKRFTRLKFSCPLPGDQNDPFPRAQSAARLSSVFGGSRPSAPHSPSLTNFTDSPALASTVWTTSILTLDLPKSAHVTATAVDKSNLARLTASEDPLLGIGSSPDSSGVSTPVLGQPLIPAQVPGHRARFFAIGTSTGMVVVWDIRAPVSQNTEIANHIDPIRIIHTESPQVSSLALSSLYLVHGGNDGLVQAWDPLVSTIKPIRTLNSRFSSRARRRLQQAETTVQGVGHNFFAAGAICLDPDPTRLRGIVALGGQLRFWSYSSSGADQYKSNKRRLRYSQRGTNRSPEADRYTHTGRGALNDYILNERRELERQKKEQEKEQKILSGRFGIDLLGPGASEEELLAYACMLSEESYMSDGRVRRESDSSAGNSSSGTIAAQGRAIAEEEFALQSPTPAFSPGPESRSTHKPQILKPLGEDLEPDIAEAIRRSLEDATPAATLNESSSEPSTNDNEHPRSSPAARAVAESNTAQQEADDFELALQLSLAVQEDSGGADSGSNAGSMNSEDHLDDDFPSLDTAAGSSHFEKGSGRRSRRGARRHGKGRP